MKIFKLLSVFAMLLFVSCGEHEKEAEDLDEMEEQAEVRDPSDANKQWIDAWNRNNPLELDTLTSADAVLYMEGETMNTDSIRSWYKNVAPMMKDLKTNPDVEYSNREVAYEAGTYSHGIKNDSLDGTYEGTYTFIWKKVDSDWKIQVMNIAGKEEDTISTNMNEE